VTAPHQTTFADESPEYAAFLAKFKPKKTTDDCYTPAPVFDAVAGYVARRFGLDPAAFVRPFWPGGDYQRDEYAPGCVVVDNPPFSIITPICEWYQARGIRFFLFCPYLSNFNAGRKVRGITHTIAPCNVLYENGAEVPTSFVHNLSPEIIAEAEPELAELVAAADEITRAKQKRILPKYSYPDEIVTSASLGFIASHGVALKIRADSAVPILAMDEQMKRGKTLFGSGLILSTRAAAERAAAERAAAERAAAHRWQLSDRERAIVAMLDAQEGRRV